MTFQPPPGPGAAPPVYPRPPPYGPPAYGPPPSGGGTNTPLVAGLLAGAVAAAAVVLAITLGGSDSGGGMPTGAGDDGLPGSGMDDGDPAADEADGAPGAPDDGSDTTAPAAGSEYVFVGDLCDQIDLAEYADRGDWDADRFETDSSQPGYLSVRADNDQSGNPPTIGQHVCSLEDPSTKVNVYVAEPPDEAIEVYGDLHLQLAAEDTTSLDTLSKGEWDNSDVYWLVELTTDGNSSSKLRLQVTARHSNLVIQWYFSQDGWLDDAGDMIDSEPLGDYTNGVLAQIVDIQRY